MLPVRRRSHPHAAYDPFEMMRRELSRMFYTPEIAAEGSEVTGEYPMDIREEDGKIIVDQEMPGFRGEEIDVSVEGDVLQIAAERRMPETKGRSHLHERCYTRVQRTVTLPCAVDDSRVDARLESGILHLEMPRAEEQRRRRIQIR